jgi:hypothetical protein
MSPTQQIRFRWTMVDCLFDEVYLGRHDDTLHGPEMLEELFRYFACHDRRFKAVGLGWDRRGFMYYGHYIGEAAIAAFLGLGLTKGTPERASQAALQIIYKPFADILEARVWLRWHVQKMYGYSSKPHDLWIGYPRNFPQITNETNELLSI